MMRHFFKTALLAIALTFTFSGAAQAADEDSIALNKWFRTAPTVGLANIAQLGQKTSRVSRGQTVYFAVTNDSTAMKTVQGTSETTCTIANADTPSTACTSAPLFIAAEDATVCIDADDSGAGASGARVNVYICSTKLCTRFTSIEFGQAITRNPILDTDETGACGPANGSGTHGTNPATKSGGQWLYYDVDIGPTGDGEVVVISVTGQ